MLADLIAKRRPNTVDILTTIASRTNLPANVRNAGADSLRQ
ncbi:MAG: hypothetical protein ABFD85_16745 [Phycisphaerae bacterium]